MLENLAGQVLHWQFLTNKLAY